MAKRKLTIEVAGDARGADALFDRLERGSGRVGSAFGTMGRLAGAALVGLGAGAAVGAVASVNAFADFDTQMREVFTLLPGISDAAMSEMSDQVKGFSADMGQLPAETVPALYQALSAGVPEGNVFDFLETAQMAAMGGVTDLRTAVDGISSVVNAYGDEVLGAGEASDMMMTGVRLGKTTFEELSASLFNVTPTAAALGVTFGDVTAGVAAMTAQGVPTSVATTQMRQMFVELSKDGGKAATVFEEMSGKTFTDFIAGGGNVAEALDVMGLAAGENGVGLADMFGSVEAGQAALALFDNDDFLTAIDEMADSAGATEGAYNTMDQGIQRVLDRLKAKFSVVMLEIGSRLAPLAEQALDGLIVVMDTLGDVTERIADAWSTDGFSGVLAEAGSIFAELWPGIRDALGEIVGSMVAWIVENGPGILTALGTWADALINWVGPKIPVVLAELGSLLEDLALWIVEDALPVIQDRLIVWGEAFAAWIPEATPGIIEALSGLAWAMGDYIVTDMTPALMGAWARMHLDLTARSAYWGKYELIPTVMAQMADLFVSLDDWVTNEAVPGFLNFGADLGGALGAGMASALQAWAETIVANFASMGTSIANAIRSAVNWIIGRWNALEFKTPGILGGWTIGTPDVAYLAAGGIFSDATFAMIGEAGREVAINTTSPLSRQYDLAVQSGLRANIAAYEAGQGHGGAPRAFADVGGKSTYVPVTIHVHGSVLAERDLERKLRQGAERGVVTAINRAGR